MKAAALAAGVCLLLAAIPAHAQFRGRLTSRPPTPTPVPRSPTNRPVLILPAWWQWEIVALPETITLTPPRLAEGAPSGGVQLDVLPWSAQVYVDGALTGRVEEFRGYYQHLTLPAGPHVIAIVHPGYDPITIELVVVPGRTVTYRATLTTR